VDMDELRIICRRGMVYLEGALPSEAEHQILLRYVTDVVGLHEIVDRLRVQELLWEREDRTPPAEESLPEGGANNTEDVVESTEEGLAYVPPTGPPPEEA